MLLPFIAQIFISPIIALDELMFDGNVDISIDTSEDILDEGISTSVYEEEEEVVEEAVEPLFVFENGVYTVNTVVEGEEYVYPDNNDVRVKFTKVTEDGNLVIKRVELSNEEKELLNTSDDYGWDITSSMSNGSFKYNLTLPNISNSKDVEVKYTEDGNTYESVDNNIQVNNNVVTIEGLEHFTIFVVVESIPTGINEGTTEVNSSCSAELSGSDTYCYDTIQKAIDAATSGDTINLLSDFTITQQININKSLTLNGNGYTIYSSFEKTDNSNNSAIGISASNVTLNDLTVDGSNGTDLHGINVYKATNVVLNDVTLKNNKKIGLVVNGSTVTVYNITTLNNGSHGINVDLGSGTTSAKLTVLGTSSHDDRSYPIYVDDRRKNVEIIPNNQYYIQNLLFHRRAYLLDKSSPSKPVLVSPINGVRINDSTPLMQWRDSTDFGTGVSGYYLEIYSNCTNFNDVSTCQIVYPTTTEELLLGSEYQTDTLPENTYLWRVKAVDKAGNESNWSNLGKFTIDTPPVFSLSGIKYTYTENGVVKTVIQDSYITNWNTPVFVGKLISTDIASVKVVINEIEYTATFNNDDITWEATISNPLDDGSYKVEIIAADLAGDTTTIEKDLFIDTVAPTAIYKHYKDGFEIDESANPITYVRGINQLSFTAEYSDTEPSSGLYQDSYVIFEAQDDGSFRFSQNGKKAFCSWRKEPNLVTGLSGDTYSLTEKKQFTNCIETLPDGEYYMAHQVYDSATRKDIPSIYQFRDVLGLHFIVDSVAPTSNINIQADLNETKDLTHNNGWHGKGWYYNFDNIVLSVDNPKPGDFIQYQIIDGDVSDPGTTWTKAGNEIDLAQTINEKADGIYTIFWYAEDLAGNTENYKREVVKIDRTQPEYEILTNTINGNKVNGVYYISSDTVKVDVKGEDSHSGYFRTRYDLYDADENWNCTNRIENSVDLPEALSEATQTLSLSNLDDGRYCMQIWVYDDVQNKSWYDINNLSQIHFVIDKTVPTIFYVNVDKTFVKAGDIITITADVTDSNGVLAVSADFSYNENYNSRPNPTSVTMTKTLGNTYQVQYTVPSDWKDGTMYIKVAARDLTGGNWVRSTEYKTVIVDNTPPEVLFANQEVPEILTELPPYQITSKSEDLLDDPVCTIGGDIPFPIDAESEYNPFTVTCTYSDLAGNENTSTYTVTVTDVPVEFTLSATKTEITQGDADIVLGTNITNGNSPYTYLWGEDCTGTGETTTFLGSSEPGDYECTVTVTDADGDTATGSIDITVGAVLGATDEATTGPSTSSTKPTTRTSVSTYALTTTTESGDSTQEREETSDESTTILGETTTETKYKISGIVFYDKNKNGIYDENEKVVEGIEVKIYDTKENLVETITTNEKGNWETTLYPGEYTTKVEGTEDKSFVLGDSDTTLDIPIEKKTQWWLIVLIGSSVIILIGILVNRNKKKEENI